MDTPCSLSSQKTQPSCSSTCDFHFDLLTVQGDLAKNTEHNLLLLPFFSFLAHT